MQTQKIPLNRFQPTIKIRSITIFVLFVVKITNFKLDSKVDSFHFCYPHTVYDQIITDDVKFFSAVK